MTAWIHDAAQQVPLASLAGQVLLVGIPDRDAAALAAQLSSARRVTRLQVGGTPGSISGVIALAWEVATSRLGRGVFEAVLIGPALERAEDARALLAVLPAWCAPGGVVVAVVPTRESCALLLECAREAALAADDPEAIERLATVWDERLSGDELAGQLGGAGFSVHASTSCAAGVELAQWRENPAVSTVFAPLVRAVDEAIMDDATRRIAAYSGTAPADSVRYQILVARAAVG